ncbi:OmpH family outer membrane protein [Desulfonatronovibrio hydrogenovorans]|uniref:OmpH family outer membrane protein n=1 Tax=Desulfonatronovibrio hydrogenovorans TaxID=53245 RepID=UPI000490A71F|nr:OmpH family outer membrane protein [Desulfonatronovibrio hydrogenovorans]
MRKIGIFFMAFILFSGPAWAEDKMAYVEVQRVLETSEPGRAALGTLTQRFEDMRAELDRERADLERLRQEMQQQSLVLSQDAQQDLESELRAKVREFQEMFQAYQARMQQEEQELSDPIIDVLFDVINDYGEKEGYTIIFDAQSSGIIYASDALNITETIIEELNKAWAAKN